MKRQRGGIWRMSWELLIVNLTLSSLSKPPHSSEHKFFLTTDTPGQAQRNLKSSAGLIRAKHGEPHLPYFGSASDTQKARSAVLIGRSPRKLGDRTSDLPNKKEKI